MKSFSENDICLRNKTNRIDINNISAHDSFIFARVNDI
jgi:hypothetical protein